MNEESERMNLSFLFPTFLICAPSVVPSVGPNPRLAPSNPQQCPFPSLQTTLGLLCALTRSSALHWASLKNVISVFGASASSSSLRCRWRAGLIRPISPRSYCSASSEFSALTPKFSSASVAAFRCSQRVFKNSQLGRAKFC